ncbi:MAG: FecR family protein [Syntrophorhabdaceae bacterium]|nr:FecR family protein [Syntrophorhabdaceae bacterium]MDD5243102.1 FecR family protein [Syntrophorhabdaceae bacterium]
MKTHISCNKVFWSFLIIAFLTGSIAFAAPVGKINAIQGRVDVLKAGKNVAAPVSLGAPVDIGDIYRTKSKSRAEIIFNNNNTLKIAPATRIEIKEYMVGKERSSTVMKLYRGKVQAAAHEDFVKRAAAFAEGNRFEVHTPNAVAGIRGSDMIVGFTNGATMVVFISGHGYLYNPGSPQVFVPIVAGQVSFITGEGTPTAPVKASEAIISGEVGAFIQVIESKGEVGSDEPPPPPPPPPPDIVTGGTNFTGEIYGGMLDDSGGAVGVLTGGTLTGNIPDTGTGTLSASGTLALDGTPTVLEGYIEGTSDKGGAFYGPLAGVQGSWLNRTAALYVEGGQVYFLTGDAPGTLTDTAFSMSGTFGKSASQGTVTLTPGPGETLLDALWDQVEYGPSPQFFPSGSPSVISNSGIEITPDYFMYTAPYLITNEGKKVAAIGNIYTGSYAPTEVTSLPYLGYAGDYEYALGPLFYSHDTTNRKFIIDTLLQSIGIDEVIGPYLGIYSMRYLGTYCPVSEIFRMSGGGTYVATPANFFGDWNLGGPGDGFSLYYNDTGIFGYAGEDIGYFGGTSAPWTSPASFTAIGTYGLSPADKAHYLMDSYISGSTTQDVSYPAAGIIEGYAAAIWKDGDPESPGTTVGSIDGAIRALYISPPDTITGLVTAGIMKSNFTGSYYPFATDSGMWGIGGTLTPTQLASGLDPAELDYDWGSMSGKLSGTFVGDTGSIYGWDDGSGETLYFYNTSSGESLPFGIFYIGFGDSDYPNYYISKPTGNPSWSAALGGGGAFGASSEDEGYWLTTISGTWKDTGEITGNVAGKALTPLYRYDMEGKFTGVNTSDTWIGQAIGSYTGTPLTSSLAFSTADATPTTLWRALPGTYYEADFTQWDASANSYHDYEYRYIQTSGKGFGKVNDDMGPYPDKLYFPNSAMLKKDQERRIWMTGWDIASIDQVRNLPGWMDPDNYSFTPTWYSEWPGFLDVLEKRSDDYLDAILGMTSYPWSTGGTPVTVIGKYTASDYTKPTIVTTPFLFGTFYTPYVAGGTANGAYGMTLGGFIADDARGVQIAIRGLFVGPDNATAGVLRGSQALTGSLYKDIGMWEAEGTVVANVMNSSFASNPEGVNIGNFSANIINGPFASQIMGRLTGDSGSLFATMENSGTTRFIKGQDWGVFSSTIWVGGFGVSSLSTTIPGTWSAQVGAEGQFGAYKDASNNWQADIGMMLIPTLSGTLTGGVAKASYTSTVGQFMTMTKMGTISDVGVLGVYTQPETVEANKLYSWQGVMGGVWNTTQYFTFASSFNASSKRFAEMHSGGYSDGSYNHYYYNYDNEVKYGEISFFSDASRTLITQRKYETDSGPFSIPAWYEYTYAKGTNTFSGYTTGTDYPASFSDAFFSDLAAAKGQPAPNQTSTWWDFSHDGSISAIMGGVGNLWTATAGSPATVYFLGDFNSWNGKPTIFGTDIVSYNVKNSTNTTLDGKGTYYGYIGGREIDGAIEGRIYAVYLDPAETSPAGILKGSFTGTVYSSDIEMWAGQGGIYPVYLMDVSVPLTSFFDHIYTGDFYDNTGSNTSFTLNGYQMGEEYSRSFTYQGEGITFSATEGSWGVWQTAVGGIYTGITPTEPWTATIEFIDSTRIMGNGVTGTKWSGNKVEGTIVGYGADIQPAQTYTWISVGELKGTFNPTLLTFQAGVMGVSVETNTYLTLAATDPGKAKLQALGIPAVQVGMATLTGSGNGFSTLSMNDVKFFATSAGGKPSIWATNSVTGNYTAPPSTSTPISLSGGTLNASFNFTQWNPSSNGKWLGSVNGTGGFNGSTTFSGAAAGTGATSGAGSITGTAAGVAK